MEEDIEVMTSRFGMGPLEHEDVGLAQAVMCSLSSRCMLEVLPIFFPPNCWGVHLIKRSSKVVGK